MVEDEVIELVCDGGSFKESGDNEVTCKSETFSAPTLKCKGL